jgi:hypothetical protein
MLSLLADAPPGVPIDIWVGFGTIVAGLCSTIGKLYLDGRRQTAVDAIQGQLDTAKVEHAKELGGVRDRIEREQEERRQEQEKLLREQQQLLRETMTTCGAVTEALTGLRALVQRLVDGDHGGKA